MNLLLLLWNTQEGKENAYSVHRKGAYTKSYANMNLNFPLGLDKIEEGTKVRGVSDNGDLVKGILIEINLKGIHQY